MDVFDCMRRCPRGNSCPSASRDYPCNVYMAMRKRRIISAELKSELRERDRKVTYRALKRIYESEGE